MKSTSSPSIVTAAGLAVVVFLVGALGSRRSDGISGAGSRPRSRRGLRGTRSWFPPPPPGRSTARSRRSSLASMRPRTIGRHRRRWGSRTSSRHGSLRTRPPIRSRRPPSVAHSRSSPPATPTPSWDSGRWRPRATTSPPPSDGDAGPSGRLPSTPTPTGSSAMRRSSWGATEPRSASFQRMVDTRPDLASYARVSYALELRGNVAGRDRRDAGSRRRRRGPGGRRLGGGADRQAPPGGGTDRPGRGVVPSRAGGGPRLDGGGGRPRARGLGVRRRADGDRRLRAARRRGSPRRSTSPRLGDSTKPPGRPRPPPLSSSSSWPRRGSSARTA